MKILVVGVCFVLVSTLSLGQKPKFEEAITPTELASIARALPSGPLYSMKLFHEKNDPRLSMAVLSSTKKNGWQVLVVSPRGRDEYTVSWTSPRLADSFEVSDPRNLGTYGLGEEEAVTFSGCGRHVCPDVFSVLLYVPSTHQAFTASCVDGKTSFSPTGSKYTEPLRELLRDQIGSEHACSLDVRGGR